jgi:ribosomal protein L10
MAPQAAANSAAKLVRSPATEKTLALEIRAGVIEGDLLVGAAAAAIADMPDRQAVRTMLAQGIIGTARKLAVALNELGASVARGLKSRSEQGGATAPAESAASESPASESPAFESPAAPPAG